MTSAPRALYGTLDLGDGRVIDRPAWSPDPSIVAARQAQLARQFFLLRIGGNDGLGEIWRCKRCRGRHAYLTWNCVERPFNGLDQVVNAVYQIAGDLGAVRSLDPIQRDHQTAKRVILREAASLPDLATLHPETARQIAASGRLGVLDVEIGGIKLGRVEPIPRPLAQRFLDKANANAPEAGRLRVTGLI